MPRRHAKKSGVQLSGLDRSGGSDLWRAPMTNSIPKEFAGSITVRAGRAAVVAPSPKKMTAKAPASAAEARTQVGREAFDRGLVELLRGVKNGMSARDIAEETGASLEQIRSSVGRLVPKKMRFEGKTAARRY